ncbi:pitrilysin family protein [Bartonella sp. TP]|uniref:M16 family metallopeptidase n=1 Tax=Bartonella sp. TP TaxID=3057550 RepID=UPI0025AFF456|nr:pitrilysin family protein [Bartonella sp. TP]WJW80185.1 pitrilysin family protein [Bartonella sp. TP]
MKVTISQLENGLTIATQKIPEIESVTAGIWIKSGSRNEAIQQHGLAHMLEHMAFKGTANRSASKIAHDIESVGGEINAATSVENTGYYTRLLQENTELGIDILSDIMTAPLFDSAELEKEKQVVLQELGAANDTPDDVVFDHFMNIAYKDQAIGRPILGTKKSVQSFQSSDMSNFMNQHYYAEHMVFVAVGAVEHDKIASNVEKGLGEFPSKKADNSYKQAKYIGGCKSEHRELMDAQVILGFEGCAYMHGDFYKTQLLSVILGGGMSSRLFQNIREELGLCYSIYAFHWGFSDTGVFGISAATDQDGIATLMPAVITELKRISENISPDEVSRALAQYKASLIMSKESSAARAPAIARQILTYGRPVNNEEILKKLHAVTPREITELAERIFLNSRPSLAAVGPIKKLIEYDDIYLSLQS